MGSQRQNSRFGYNIKLLIYGGLVTLTLAIFTIFPPAIVQNATNKSYDVLMRTLPALTGKQASVIVGIDDKSLAAYGQWPWPRYILARLIKKIGNHGAACIAVDMIFPEPDRTSPSVVFEEMRREWGVSVPDNILKNPKAENDQILASALRATPSVLGYQFIFDSKPSAGDESLQPLRYVIQEQLHRRKCRFLMASGVIHSLPLLMDAAGSSGFVNALTDPDGVIRRVPLVLEYHGKLYPSLAMASILKAYGNIQVRIATGEDGFSLEWNGKRIPLDCRGFFLVDYRGKSKNFLYMSASDILSDKIPEGSLHGKIVFIGLNASGMGDWHLTPFGNMAHGMEVHANIVNNILSGDFIRRPAWARGAELVMTVSAGLLSSVALAAGGALWCLVFTMLAGVATGVLFYYLFLTHGIFLSPVMPLSVLVINFAVLNTVKYGLEELKVRQRSLELIKSQDVAILSLSTLVEARDEETGHHILRTQRYVRVLAQRLRQNPKYKKILDDQVISLLYKSAPLHDIGKVGIPDWLLKKAGNLTAEEYDQMKTHTVIGSRTIQKAGKMLKGKFEFPYLKYAYEVAISHHEKWDGSGYPYGLKGEDIPLSGRLMALADVYDALISTRVYKPAYSHERARKMIIEEKGRHFDPDVVDAFLDGEQEFLNIALELPDSK